MLSGLVTRTNGPHVMMIWLTLYILHIYIWINRTTVEISWMFSLDGWSCDFLSGNVFLIEENVWLNFKRPLGNCGVNSLTNSNTVCPGVQWPNESLLRSKIFSESLRCTKCGLWTNSTLLLYLFSLWVKISIIEWIRKMFNAKHQITVHQFLVLLVNDSSELHPSGVQFNFGNHHILANTTFPSSFILRSLIVCGYHLNQAWDKRNWMLTKSEVLSLNQSCTTCYNKLRTDFLLDIILKLMPAIFSEDVWVGTGTSTQHCRLQIHVLFPSTISAMRDYFHYWTS